MVDFGAETARGPARVHWRQLDGLRGLAALAVLVSHWLPPELRFHLSPGRLGVNLFFVLSGFLITGILLRARERVHAGRQPLGAALASFYARRCLRLLPLLYALLGAGCLLGVSRVQETWPWHAAGLSNVYLALRGDWAGSVSHLWSIAVELQFYLVWPWLILGLPRRWLPWAIAALAASAPLFRTAGHGLDGSGVALRVLTPACLDTLGAGALLALAAERRALADLAGSRRARLLAWVGVPLLIGATLPSAWDPAALPFVALQGVGSALAFGWLVLQAAAGRRGRFGRLLETRALVYVGHISYGVYVIHMFAPALVRDAAAAAGVGASLGSPLALLLQLGLTLGLASLSWHLMEHPIQRLGRTLLDGGVRPAREPRHPGIEPAPQPGL